MARRYDKHGCAGVGNVSKTYTLWAAMKARCLRPTHKNYASYGGRGITVCPRWLSFKNFYEDMGDKPAGKFLERIDNDKGYEPANCRWASWAEQARNKRQTRWITFNSETLCMADWERKLGLGSGTLLYRLAHGWTLEKAMTSPKMRPGEYRKHKGLIVE